VNTAIRRPLVLCLLALALAAVPALAAPASILDDPAFRQDVQAGLDRLYSMDFAGADAAFARVEQRFPGHPAGPFLRALIPWWNLLLDPENTSLDAGVTRAMDEVLKRSRARLRKNPDDLDGLFFETGALAFRARVATYRRHWYRAAQDGRRSLKNLRRLHRRDPDNPDLLFGLGLFDYLADIVPKRYKFLRPVAVLFPKGDRLRGLGELEKAASRGHFVQTEARFALYQIYDRFEKNREMAASNLLWLRGRYPDNALFHVAEGRHYALQARWAEASIILQEVAARQVAGNPGYTGSIAQEALYWLARGEMATRSYETALQYLDRLEFLAAERTYDRYYQAVGRLRRGMAYDALGRRVEAQRCYREVLAMEGAADARDRAREFLQKPYQG
jgi:tetratricopeptide (TPR) repeat protein